MKTHEYKGKLIENVPYKGEPRWFISENDGTRTLSKTGKPIFPSKTLKESKEIVDRLTVTIGEGKKMKSCWLIEFADGQKMIIDEELYKQECERNWAGRPRTVEEHWFDINKCIERNRGVSRFGIGMPVE